MVQEKFYNEPVTVITINIVQTQYMLVSCHWNVEQNHNIKIANSFFENAAKCKYLGITVTNQNLFLKKLRAD
jgi:hypothetical protein